MQNETEINCENFDDYLEQYSQSNEIQQLMDTHAKKCMECQISLELWEIMEGSGPDYTGDPDYQRVKENVKKRVFKRLGNKITIIISKNEMLEISGQEKTTYIPEEFLAAYGFCADTRIIFEQTSKGYRIWMESSIPKKVKIAFLKNDIELYQTEINELIPTNEELVPIDTIKGWDSIKLLRS